MNKTLERRFFRLAMTMDARDVAMEQFKMSFVQLFEAFAEDTGKTGLELAKLMGWEPVPLGGNAIMNGKAEPSHCDIARLLGIWEQFHHGD